MKNETFLLDQFQVVVLLVSVRFCLVSVSLIYFDCVTYSLYVKINIFF